MLTVFLIIVMCVAALSLDVVASEEGTADRVAQLEATVAQLQAEVARLEGRLAELESLLEEVLQQRDEGRGSPERDEEKSESSAPSLAGASWKRMSQNWEYRNASIRPGTLRDTFIIELRRIGPPVSSAMMTVTLYDEEGRIVATGTGSVLTMTTGDVRTVDFWLDAKPTDARTWRLQVDYEI